MVGETHAHLDDILASQHQSIDWTQHTIPKLQAAFSDGEPFAPRTTNVNLHTRSLKTAVLASITFRQQDLVNHANGKAPAGFERSTSRKSSQRLTT